MEEVRRGVKRFAQKMEDKLRAKDDAYGEEGWLNKECTIQFLCGRLDKKAIHLKFEFDVLDSSEVDDLCVDIANFAMMVSDRIKDLNKGEEG